MNIKSRTSKQIVNAFLRSNSTIQAEVLRDVAMSLSRKNRGGSVDEMVCLLRRALADNRLFEFKENGMTYYQTKEAFRRRNSIPKGAPKSAYINAVEPVFA